MSRTGPESITCFFPALAEKEAAFQPYVNIHSVGLLMGVHPAIVMTDRPPSLWRSFGEEYHVS